MRSERSERWNDCFKATSAFGSVSIVMKKTGGWAWKGVFEGAR